MHHTLTTKDLTIVLTVHRSADRALITVYYGDMAELKFNEEEPFHIQPSATAKPSLLTTLIIRTGLAKDAAGAQRVLLVVLVLALAAIIVLLLPRGPRSPEIPLGAPLHS
jgi:hypothetical protein